MKTDKRDCHYFNNCHDTKIKNVFLSDEILFPQAIHEARIKRKITQKELSDRSGIDQSEISKIEAGLRNPSVRLLNRIAKAMDMSLVISFVSNVQRE